jgi:hypothetical protein
MKWPEQRAILEMVQLLTAEHFLNEHSLNGPNSGALLQRNPDLEFNTQNTQNTRRTVWRFSSKKDHDELQSRATFLTRVVANGSACSDIHVHCVRKVEKVIC